MRYIVGSLVLAALLTAHSLAWAQAGATAQISGTVKDQSGAVLPGASVTVVQTETGFTRTVVAESDGSYVIPNLPIGPYRLEAMLQGFRSYVQTGLVLQVGSNPTVNVTLTLGVVSETVLVQANTLMVETRSTGIGQVMDNQRILDLPLNGRNPADLLQFLPAAVPNPALNATSRSMQGGQAYSVAGGQSYGVTYLLDGAMHNNPYDNLNLPLPFPDALQEFKVETSAMTAQNGMHAGAAVNAVTKSGTNQYRGDLFEFWRNHVFNATAPFAARGADGSRVDDALNRNQYGGTLGGPLVRDRLFFFGAYQGTQTDQASADNRAFVPTAAMLTGDFTAFASPACNAGRQVTLRPPFLNNSISPSQFSQAALNISSRLPTTDDPCGLVRYGLPTAIDEGQSVAKIDYQVRSNHSLFGRYMATGFYQPPPSEASPDNILTTTRGGRDNLAQAFTIGENYVINANTVNTVRFAFNRTAIHRTQTDFFSAPEIGINIYDYMPHYMLLTVNNGFSLGGGTEDEFRATTNTWQVSDDATLVRGGHQFGFGVNVSHWNSAVNSNVRSPGQLTIDGSATGLGLADFLTGRLTTLQQSAPNSLYAKQTYLGVYAQDTWRIGSRVTLNYGLRWEPFFPQQIYNNAIYNFDESRFRQNVRSVTFRNAPAGLYFPGDPGFPTQAGMNIKWGDVGPRIGIAWQPTDDGRTSVRASYSKSFEFVNGQFHMNTSNAPPWGSEIRLNSPGGGLDNPFVGSGQTNIFPVTFDANAPFSLFGPFLALDYDMPTTAVHLWNVSVERQILSDWLVSAGYVGSRTTNLWESVPLNNALATVTSASVGGATTTCTPGAANFQTCMNSIVNQRRPFYLADPLNGQYFGPVDRYVADGTQRYNGLLLSVTRRAVRGVTINANYTLSHCYGSPDGGGGTTTNLSTGYNDPNNPHLDDGNCTSDRRHNLSLTAGAGTPQFTHHLLRAIASEWRLVGSFRAVSGPYLTVTPGSDRALNGQAGTQRVNQVLDNPYGDTSVVGAQYLNPSAFAQPALGTLGTLPRNSILGVGSRNIDVALTRVVRLGKMRSIEFRSEAFNVFNWFQWGQPVTNLVNGQFGQIVSAGAPRILQFAAKYTF